MKKLSLILILALCISLLAGCAGTPVVYYTNCTCPAGGTSQEQAPSVQTPAVPVTEGSVKTGLAVIANASNSQSAAADAAGKAEYDVTLVAVNVDDKGVITACVIDSLGCKVEFDSSGVITSDLNGKIVTKNELADDYGMKLYGGAKYEWYEQANAMAQYAVGKTVEELKNGAINEAGMAADADLASTATIYLGGYVSAIEQAVNAAQHLGAQAGDELRLCSISKLTGSTAATAEAAGNAQLDCDVTALTLRDGVITSCVIDSLQGKVAFDATGAITSDTASLPTKNDLGEGYGMVAWGGAIAEWNAQAAAFAAYITGKTPDQVSGIAVSETTVPTDADLSASVTIAIGGFQALIAKATAE